MTSLTAFNQAHITHSDIQAFIQSLSKESQVRVREVGQSYEQRPIHLLSLGNGPTVIFAWTQMHGNEATATAAVFDLIYALLQNDVSLPVELKHTWQNQFTLHILPMLNPDGAERCIRQNAQAIDINRDAQALQSPEGRLLMQLVDELQPDIGFNLHDQSPYYQCGTTGNPATIAFLAPAFDVVKTVDKERLRAFAMINCMDETLQKLIPNCVARYDDTYSPRSFGDNIAGKKITTILIESGAASKDPNRQIARQLNVSAILSAMAYLSKSAGNELVDKDHAQSIQDRYFSIPENKSEALSSLIISDLSFANGTANAYSAGVSIKQSARYSDHFFIDFVGELGIQAGLQSISAKGLNYQQGKCYVLDGSESANYFDLLSQGYLAVYAAKEEYKKKLNNPEALPVYWAKSESDVIGTPSALVLNQAAFLLFSKQNEIVAALLNGRYVELI